MTEQWERAIQAVKAREAVADIEIPPTAEDGEDRPELGRAREAAMNPARGLGAIYGQLEIGRAACG